MASSMYFSTARTSLLDLCCRLLAVFVATLAVIEWPDMANDGDDNDNDEACGSSTTGTDIESDFDLVKLELEEPATTEIVLPGIWVLEDNGDNDVEEAE